MTYTYMIVTWILRTLVYALLAVALIPAIGYWPALLVIILFAAFMGYVQAKMGFSQ